MIGVPTPVIDDDGVDLRLFHQELEEPKKI